MLFPDLGWRGTARGGSGAGQAVRVGGQGLGWAGGGSQKGEGQSRVRGEGPLGLCRSINSCSRRNVGLLLNYSLLPPTWGLPSCPQACPQLPSLPPSRNPGASWQPPALLLPMAGAHWGHAGLAVPRALTFGRHVVCVGLCVAQLLSFVFLCLIFFLRLTLRLKVSARAVARAGWACPARPGRPSPGRRLRSEQGWGVALLTPVCCVPRACFLVCKMGRPIF